MTEWRLIDSSACSAACNMAVDEAIAVSVMGGYSPPTLRFYEWECVSVSIGAFQNLKDIDLEYCWSNNIPVVKRPTGGRGILHGDELTYSFSCRNEGIFSKGLLDTYRHLSAALCNGLQMMGIKAEMKRERESGRNLTKSPLCFNSTSYGEVSFNGRKLIGSAQKRWREGFLQQGSIPYSLDYEKMAMAFKYGIHSAQCREAMIGLKELIQFSHEEFKGCLKMSFEGVFNITLVESPLSPHEQELAQLLSSEKYQNPEWTTGAAGDTRFCSNK